MVSVIIPVFNGEVFIEENLQNVLAQQYPALEIIVVNDGSTDGTGRIVQDFNAEIQYYYQDNQGPSHARNLGIHHATGDYIAFLDADDLWPENNLLILSDYLMHNPETEIVRGYGQVMKKDEKSGVYEPKGDPKTSFPAFIGAALYRKEVFERVGLFDTSLHFGEDADWYMRAVESGIKMHWLDRVTLYVRRHGKNMTEGKDLVALNTLKVFKKAIDRMRNQSKE